MTLKRFASGIRPTMRFVAVKSIEQQDTLCLHRVRERLVAAKVCLINEIRGCLMNLVLSCLKEFGK